MKSGNILGNNDMSIFFVSDTHFSHVNVLKHCGRPFKNIEEHDEEIIRRWNNKVSKKDTVYHLGDFTFKSSKHVREFTNRLNGRIVLILGNHDQGNPQITEVFGQCPQILRIKYYKQRIILSHYQLANWQGKNRDIMPSWSLWGHAHGTTPLHKIEPRSMDVGVDSNNFTPLSFEEIKQAFEDNHESQRPSPRENNICPP